MANTLPPPPPLLDPSVSRYNADGTPTTAQVVYEKKLQAWYEALAAIVRDA